MTKGQSLFLFGIILLILITITLGVFVNIVRRKLMFVRHKLRAPCEDPLNNKNIKVVCYQPCSLSSSAIFDACDVTCQACLEKSDSVPSLIRSLGQRDLASGLGWHVIVANVCSQLCVADMLTQQTTLSMGLQGVITHLGFWENTRKAFRSRAEGE